jgi:predicted kinase
VALALAAGKMAPDAMPEPPLLVVVTGPPAGGKTSVAERLAGELRLPLVAKDAFKETLADALGAPADDEASQRLGEATFPLLFLVLEHLLAAGVSVVAEADFRPGPVDERFARLAERLPHRTVQVHASAPYEVLVERYRERAESGERHPIHVDEERLDDMVEKLARDEWPPLPLDGETLELDTAAADEAELDRLVGRVRGSL